MGGEEYEVKGTNGSQYVVNVANRECSCRRWELTGIPCAHAVATNYNMSLNGINVGIPEEWVHKCYWLSTWKNAYSHKIGCINGKIMWKKSQIPTKLTPPKHLTQVGRPKKNRRKTKEEKAMVKDGKLSRAFKTVTCNKCGHMGHNKRSCKGQTMNQPVGSSAQAAAPSSQAKKRSSSKQAAGPSSQPKKRSSSTGDASTPQCTQGASTQAAGIGSKGRKRSSSTQAAAASAPKKQKKKATGGGNGGSQKKDKVAV